MNKEPYDNPCKISIFHYYHGKILKRCFLGEELLIKFLVILIILIIFSFFLDKLLRKRLGVEKIKISETSAKNVDRWGRGIILVILLCTLPFVITKDTNVMKWYWILYLILLLGFQSFVQWKYLKNSKEHLITLMSLMVGVIIIYNMAYFI